MKDTLLSAMMNNPHTKNRILENSGMKQILYICPDCQHLEEKPKLMPEADDEGYNKNEYNEDYCCPHCDNDLYNAETGKTAIQEMEEVWQSWLRMGQVPTFEEAHPRRPW